MCPFCPPLNPDLVGGEFMTICVNYCMGYTVLSYSKKSIHAVHCQEFIKYTFNVEKCGLMHCPISQMQPELHIKPRPESSIVQYFVFGF